MEKGFRQVNSYLSPAEQYSQREQVTSRLLICLSFIESL